MSVLVDKYLQLVLFMYYKKHISFSAFISFYDNKMKSTLQTVML